MRYVAFVFSLAVLLLHAPASAMTWTDVLDRMRLIDKPGGSVLWVQSSPSAEGGGKTDYYLWLRDPARMPQGAAWSKTYWTFPGEQIFEFGINTNAYQVCNGVAGATPIEIPPGGKLNKLPGQNITDSFTCLGEVFDVTTGPQPGTSFAVAPGKCWVTSAQVKSTCKSGDTLAAEPLLGVEPGGCEWAYVGFIDMGGGVKTHQVSGGCVPDGFIINEQLGDSACATPPCLSVRPGTGDPGAKPGGMIGQQAGPPIAPGPNGGVGTVPGSTGSGVPCRGCSIGGTPGGGGTNPDVKEDGKGTVPGGGPVGDGPGMKSAGTGPGGGTAPTGDYAGPSAGAIGDAIGNALGEKIGTPGTSPDIAEVPTLDPIAPADLPVKSDIKQLVTSFASNHPLMTAIKGSTFTAGGSCSFAFGLGPWGSGSIDLCSHAGTLQLVGIAVMAFCNVWAAFIIFGRG